MRSAIVFIKFLYEDFQKNGVIPLINCKTDEIINGFFFSVKQFTLDLQIIFYLNNLCIFRKEIGIALIQVK